MAEQPEGECVDCGTLVATLCHDCDCCFNCCTCDHDEDLDEDEEDEID